MFVTQLQDKFSLVWDDANPLRDCTVSAAIAQPSAHPTSTTC